jgi:HSP20 family protein
MAMERWDPFSDLMNRMLGDWYFRPWRSGTNLGYSLPIDVCETENEFIVRAAAPGIRPEDLDVSVKEDVLTIRGEITAPDWMRSEQSQTTQTRGTQTQSQGQMQGQSQGQMSGQPQGQQYGQSRQGMQMQGTHCWLQEIPTGHFTRSVTLPSPVNGTNARAEFDNGMLTLHLPKTEEARPRRIEIQGGAGRQLGSGQTPGQTGR